MELIQVPEDANRDFTASSYVIKDGKILLLRHQKLGMWLQPGGHIEEDELPHETAWRETREETGYSIEFLNRPESPDYDEAAYDLPQPMKTNVHQIEEGHWHCDFAFRAAVDSEEKATHNDEHEGMRWFTIDELKSGDFEMPENVRRTSIEALEMHE